MKSESILAIIGICIAVAAVGVTAWMAVETRRMAGAAKKTFELEQMPILGLRDLRIEIGKQAGQQAPLACIRVGMELFNAGRVPVKYKVKSSSVKFANQGTSFGQFLSHGGRVLPGASTFFWHPTLSLKPPVSTFPNNGRACFEYEYCDESGRQQHLIRETLEYTVSRAEDGSFVSGWLNVDEPSAS
jgi:hypothetical protein